MINSEIRDTKPASHNYPFLGVTTEGMIVLFTAEKTGVVVESLQAHNPIGTFSDRWLMDYFRPLSKDIKVVLSNQ